MLAAKVPADKSIEMEFYCSDCGSTVMEFLAPNSLPLRTMTELLLSHVGDTCPVCGQPFIKEGWKWPWE